MKTTILRDPWINPRSKPPVIVQCDAEGKPDPVITWEKIDGVGSPSYTAQDGVLLFLMLQENVDSGLYVCNASNGLTEDLSYMAGRRFIVLGWLVKLALQRS